MGREGESRESTGGGTGHHRVPKDNLPFYGPVGKEALAHMLMCNVTDRQICFKVRTNESEHMTITPQATGILQPDERMNVELTLSPKFDRTKETVMVVLRAVYLPATNKETADAIWASKPTEFSDTAFKVTVQSPEVPNAEIENLTTMFLHKKNDRIPTMVTDVAMPDHMEPKRRKASKHRRGTAPNPFSPEIYHWFVGQPPDQIYPISCLMLFAAIVGLLLGMILAK